jgi:hypothetical protein
MANEVLTKRRNGMLEYRYVSDDDAALAFEASVLADIAEPYKQRFREEIQDQNWIVEFNRQIPESPFKADFVLCTADMAI